MKRFFIIVVIIFLSAYFTFTQQIEPQRLNGNWWNKLSYNDKIIYCVGFISANNSILEQLADVRSNIPNYVYRNFSAETYFVSVIVESLISEIERGFNMPQNPSELVEVIDYFYSKSKEAREYEIPAVIYSFTRSFKEKRR